MRQNIVKTTRFLLATCVLAATAVNPVFALEGEPATQFVLEGLDRVHVTVDPLSKVNLDAGAMQKDIEAQFEKGGMKIVDKKEFLNDTTIDQFLVKVTPLKKNKKIFYAINVGLTQMVYLEDKPDRKISVTAWQNQSLGLAEPGKEGEIKKEIMAKVDSFIDLWQRANGKEKVK